MPDSVVNSGTSTSGPAVQGSVFGGHAPIQGSHVYLLQPSTTAYGGAATSLLNNNAAPAGSVDTSNGYPLTMSTGGDGSFTNGAYYVTTDANGAFNLTGYYSCTPSQPVYLYAYGGNIGTIATSPTTVSLNVTSATANRTGGLSTYTFTAANTNPVPLAVGNTVTLAITGGTNWNRLTTGTVATASSTGFTVTSTTNLTISGTGTGTATYTYTQTGNAVPTTNNNIVQLLTLGVCPKNGVPNFGSQSNNPINFVYLNEVSTIATAYTFQPFTLPGNNDAWHIGTTGGTVALVGIANAANTASQLYDIQGGQEISSSGDGEGHVANVETVGAVVNTGLGLVPQATIDSLANIIAACVDSVPTIIGTPTTQCNDLFNIARADGTTTGTKPVDTATAAINIARFPSGNHSSTSVDATYVSDLFAIPTTVVPYVPALTVAPNDWLIAINYTYAGVAPNYVTVQDSVLGRAESVAIDGLGQIWVTAQTNTDVVRFSPLGADNAVTNNLGYIPGYVSIDGSNNAYTGNANNATGTAIYEAGSNGTFHATFGSGYQYAYVNIADSIGDDYFFAKTAATGGNYEMFEFPHGSNGTTVPNQYNISPGVITAGNDIAHGAIDAAGDFWLTTESSNQIARVSSTGVAAFPTFTTAKQPEFPSIDAAGNAWIAIQQTNAQLYQVSPTGTQTIFTPANTGAEMTSTFGSAIDGNGNIWATNRSGNYGSVSGVAGTNTIFVLNGSGAISTATTGSQVGAGTSGTQYKAISPGTNYSPSTQYYADPPTNVVPPVTPMFNDSLNIAIDPSGNVWVTNYLGSAVVEIVGAAAPVVTPLSSAAASGKLGQKPN